MDLGDARGVAQIGFVKKKGSKCHSVIDVTLQNQCIDQLVFVCRNNRVMLNKSKNS